MVGGGKAVLSNSTTASTTMTISIRLLREGKGVVESLRDISKLTEVKAKEGRLFIDQSSATPPSWLKFVSEFAFAPPLDLQNKSCSSILFLETPSSKSNPKNRTFALTFGGGHHYLVPDVFERNFGLKVALNSIIRKNLKSIDVATLEATSFQKRIQASRKADLDGFGIDVQRELLRLAGGVPTDSGFASSISGKDALTITAKIKATDVLAKCEKALDLFRLPDYKKDYSFVDHIVPVRDKNLIEYLDDSIFSELKNLIAGQTSDLHLAVPELSDPSDHQEFGYFGAGLRSGSKTKYCELTIEDYISELISGRPDDLKEMADIKRSHETRVILNGHSDKVGRHRIYDCFVYEFYYKKSNYVIFNGDWYCIDRKFFKEIDERFKALVSSSPIITKTISKNEQELILELDKNIDLLNLDRVKSSPLGAVRANIEPCDFFSRKKEFIHLKDGHSSAPISHLWSQGVVSAESFMRDEVFRKSMRLEAKKRQIKVGKSGFELLLPNGSAKPIAADYKVIYGIMRHPYKKSKKLDLPFFSKVSLGAAASRIQLVGYGLEVHLIEKM